MNEIKLFPKYYYKPAAILDAILKNGIKTEKWDWHPP